MPQALYYVALSYCMRTTTATTPSLLEKPLDPIIITGPLDNTSAVKYLIQETKKIYSETLQDASCEYFLSLKNISGHNFVEKKKFDSDQELELIILFKKLFQVKF